MPSIESTVRPAIATDYLYGRKHRLDVGATNHVNMGIFVPALAGKSIDPDLVQMIALGGLAIVLGSGARLADRTPASAAWLGSRFTRSAMRCSRIPLPVRCGVQDSLAGQSPSFA